METQHETVIEVHTANSIKIRVGESGCPFPTSHEYELHNRSPVTRNLDCHWWVANGSLLRHALWKARLISWVIQWSPITEHFFQVEICPSTYERPEFLFRWMPGDLIVNLMRKTCLKGWTRVFTHCVSITECEIPILYVC